MAQWTWTLTNCLPIGQAKLLHSESRLVEKVILSKKTTGEKGENGILKQSKKQFKTFPKKRHTMHCTIANSLEKFFTAQLAKTSTNITNDQQLTCIEYCM